MFLVLQISIFLTVTSYLWRRDFLFPGFLVSVGWMFVSLIHGIQDSIGEIELQTQLLIAGGTTLFTIGAMLTSGSSIRAPSDIRILTGVPSLTAQRIASIVSTALVVLMMLKAIEIGRNGPTDNWLINLKLEMVEGTGYGLLRYGIPIVYVTAYSAILRLATRGFDAASLIAIIVAFIGAIITIGRGAVLHFLVLLLMPMLCLGKARMATVAMCGLFFVMFFLSLGMIMGKADGLQLDGGTVDLTALWGMISTYIVGGAGALNHFVEAGSSLDGGANTFRALVALMHAIGLGAAPKELVEGYVYVPAPTNVYSYYYPIFTDFGILTAALAQFPIGLMFGVLYRTVRTTKVSTFALFFFSAGCFPLIMQFQQDYLIVSMSLWVQYVVVGFIFLRGPTSLRGRANSIEAPKVRPDSR